MGFHFVGASVKAVPRHSAIPIRVTRRDDPPGKIRASHFRKTPGKGGDNFRTGRWNFRPALKKRVYRETIQLRAQLVLGVEHARGRWGTAISRGCSHYEEDDLIGSKKKKSSEKSGIRLLSECKEKSRKPLRTCGTGEGDVDVISKQHQGRLLDELLDFSKELSADRPVHDAVVTGNPEVHA